MLERTSKGCFNRGVGTRGPGHRRHVPPPKFFERTKSALFVMKSVLFVQTNVVNTNLTLKVPFVLLKFIRSNNS